MAFLPNLLGIDFNLLCSPTAFCSVCFQGVCLRCCPIHRELHHGGEGHLLQVGHHEGSVVVSAIDIRRITLRYDWREIERVEDPSGKKLIHVGRHVPNNRSRANCSNCRDKISAGSLHCSPACKLRSVPGGHGRIAVESLVNYNFEETRIPDSFCTTCMLAFSSEHCDHQHNGDDGGVLHIVRQDGWLLIPREELAEEVAEGISLVESEEGVGLMLIPVRPRFLPNNNGPHICRRGDCAERVEQAGDACSIFCKYWGECKCNGRLLCAAAAFGFAAIRANCWVL